MPTNPSTPNLFSRQPTVVRVAVGVTLYLAFVHFEELVIDRHGLWRFLPSTKFGKFCPWDVAALATIVWFVGAGDPATDSEGRAGGGSASRRQARGGRDVRRRGPLGCRVHRALRRDPTFPVAAIGAALLAVVMGTAWWLIRRSDGSSFASQPMLVKVAAVLAVSNSLLFFAY